jgi:hypothetical protein
VSVAEFIETHPTGAFMVEPGGDVIKRRLVDRTQITAVVDYMRGHGLESEAIAVELARLFYVDMDELNSVLTEPDLPAPNVPLYTAAQPAH